MGMDNMNTIESEDDLRKICTFCAEIKKQEQYNLYYEMFGKQINYRYILKETEHFLVIPPAGSFVPGYLEIIPKEHVPSFGQLSSKLDEELTCLCILVEDWIKKYYSKYVIYFEHGSVNFKNRGGSTSDHAHLHIVPVTKYVDLAPSLFRDFNPKKTIDFSAIHEQVKTGNPYLLYTHHDNTMYICDASNAKSQYFRRETLIQLGLEELWDWKTNLGKENILKTIEMSEKYAF